MRGTEAVFSSQYGSMALRRSRERKWRSEKQPRDDPKGEIEPHQAYYELSEARLEAIPTDQTVKKNAPGAQVVLLDQHEILRNSPLPPSLKRMMPRMIPT